MFDMKKDAVPAAEQPKEKPTPAYLREDYPYLAFGKVMMHIDGPVKIRNGNEVKDFLSGEEAARSFSYSSGIEAISAAGGVVVVDISSKIIEKNDINEEWVKKTEAETGEKISFF